MIARPPFPEAEVAWPRQAERVREPYIDTPPSEIKRISWTAFRLVFNWRQGEHVTLIGPTGRGKTTLALRILPIRNYVVIFAAKPRDPLLEEAVKMEGYRIVETWPPPPMFPRVIFWPRIKSPDDIDLQKEAFRLALIDIYQRGGWCLYIDELRYITQFLGLSSLVELLWLQGRSLEVSVVGGTQRPAWVPLSAYDQASHLFVWRDNDERNIRRLSEMASLGSGFRDAATSLGDHEVLYISTRDGRLFVTEAPRLPA